MLGWRWVVCDLPGEADPAALLVPLVTGQAGIDDWLAVVSTWCRVVVLWLGRIRLSSGCLEPFFSVRCLVGGKHFIASMILSSLHVCMPIGDCGPGYLCQRAPPFSLLGGVSAPTGPAFMASHEHKWLCCGFPLLPLLGHKWLC